MDRYKKSKKVLKLDLDLEEKIYTTCFFLLESFPKISFLNTIKMSMVFKST